MLSDDRPQANDAPITDDAALLREVEELIGADSTQPISIDSPMQWGKHKDLSYRKAAELHPGYVKWAATKIGGTRGQLCAEALALYLGVTE